MNRVNNLNPVFHTQSIFSVIELAIFPGIANSRMHPEKNSAKW
jgi:hypothetical protein